MQNATKHIPNTKRYVIMSGNAFPIESLMRVMRLVTDTYLETELSSAAVEEWVSRAALEQF